jgi:NADH-quinone oxidoreductase subunit N
LNPLSNEQLQQTFKGVFRLVGPEIALIAAACVIFLFGCLYNRRWLWFLTSFIGIAIAGVIAGTVKVHAPPIITAAPIVPDAAAAFIRWVAIITAAVLLFVSWAEVKSESASEYYGCLLVATAGVSLTGRANDLITLFLALELISIPTYILLYLPDRSRLKQEAAAKYFLLSVMSSALLLFGFSYLYGLAGSTNIAVIVDALTKAHTQNPNAEALSPMAMLGIVLVVAAIGFRITAVPFHFYAPDVYEGGPAGVVALLAFFPKVAGFAALARLLGMIGADPYRLPFDADTHLPLLLWIISILTMTLGNVLALLQINIRRMLAYSSVAHAGYMLMGVVAASSYPDIANAAKSGYPNAIPHGPATGGIDALLVYLVAYGMMTIGAFAVILYLSTPERSIESIDDLAGLGKSHPMSAGTMAIFLFSLIGMPPTAGFIGKWLLFLGTYTAPSDTPTMHNFYQLLAVIAAINAAIGAYYYLRVIGVMYLRIPLRPLASSRAFPTLLAAVVLAAGTLFFLCYSDPLAKAARKAAPVANLPGKNPASGR